MALYAYYKSELRSCPKRLSSTVKRCMAGLFFVMGAGLILVVAFPIIKYQLLYAPKFSYVLSPIPDGYKDNYDFSSLIGEDSIPLASSDALGPENKDLSNINNWFSDTLDFQKDDFDGTSYFLSVPELEIYNAKVIVGAQDLSENLSQYSGTAIPGKPGNTVILGHSVLPQFFNPNNYLTIFSLLYRLELGDEIIIKYDGRSYSYLIDDIYEVQPTNLSPLAQRYDDSFLTLITCSPPGTYLRRLIVQAKLTTIK
jgi:sortase A